MRCDYADGSSAATHRRGVVNHPTSAPRMAPATAPLGVNMIMPAPHGPSRFWHVPSTLAPAATPARPPATIPATTPTAARRTRPVRGTSMSKRSTSMRAIPCGMQVRQSSRYTIESRLTPRSSATIGWSRQRVSKRMWLPAWASCGACACTTVPARVRRTMHHTGMMPGCERTGAWLGMRDRSAVISERGKPLLIGSSKF